MVIIEVDLLKSSEVDDILGHLYELVLGEVELLQLVELLDRWSEVEPGLGGF